MGKELVGLFVQSGVYNQVIIGDTREDCEQAAAEWFRSMGIKVPNDVTFDEWYHEAYSHDVYVWDSDKPVIVAKKKG